jgi:Protein of unknown function (DUF2510)
MDAPAGWYPEPTTASNDVPMLRFWDGAWTAQTAPGMDGEPPAAVDRQRIEPWALVLSLLPLICILGGAISMIKGKTRTGGLMMLIGFTSLIVLQLVGAAEG